MDTGTFDDFVTLLRSEGYSPVDDETKYSSKYLTRVIDPSGNVFRTSYERFKKGLRSPFVQTKTNKKPSILLDYLSAKGTKRGDVSFDDRSLDSYIISQKKGILLVDLDSYMQNREENSEKQKSLSFILQGGLDVYFFVDEKIVRIRTIEKGEVSVESIFSCKIPLKLGEF